jgi:hypothetical protein
VPSRLILKGQLYLKFLVDSFSTTREEMDPPNYFWEIIKVDFFVNFSLLLIGISWYVCEMCVSDGIVLAFASAQRFVGMGFWHL